MAEELHTFSAEIDGRRFDFNTSTGDYRIAACKAIDLAEQSIPAIVKIWCEKLLPDYGPYEYRVYSDQYGRLVVAALN